MNNSGCIIKDFIPGATENASNCFSCNSQATVQCIQCRNILFCRNCFDKSHRMQGINHSQVEPLVITPLLQPVKQPVCYVAGHSTAEKFCLDCANQLCSKCSHSAEHAGHSLCDFGQANIHLLNWLLGIGDSLNNLASRLGDCEQALQTEALKLQSEARHNIEAAVRADFDALRARLLAAERQTVSRLVEDGVRRPLENQRSRILNELHQCANWLQPLSLSLKALRAADSNTFARWCPNRPFDYAKLTQLLGNLASEPACLATGASSPVIALNRDPTSQPTDAGHYSIARPPSLTAGPLAALDPNLLTQLLSPNLTAEIFGFGSSDPAQSLARLPSPILQPAIQQLDTVQLPELAPLSTGDAVTPVCINSPYDIWVVRFNELDLVKKLQELCCHAVANYQLAAISADSLRPGDWVLSRYKTDSDWCRAIVDRLISGQCDLNFPDYGSSVSNVPVESLLQIPPGLCQMRPLAHRIRLDGVRPRRNNPNDGPADQWSSAAILALQKILLTDKCLSGDIIVRVVSNQPREVLVDLLIRTILHDCDLRYLSVREMLIFAELACYTIPYLHNREASNELVDAQAPRLFMRPASVIKGHRFFGNVSAYYSPYEFYVFRCNKGADTDVFINMHDKLQTFCIGDSNGDYTVKHPVSNLPVAARYSVDGNWYRGIIESYSPDGVHILFTDYGNREVHKDASCIKYLTKRFYQPHSMCFRCSMFGVAATDDVTPRTKSRHKQLQDMLHNAEGFLFLCMDTPTVASNVANTAGDSNSNISVLTVPVGVYHTNSPICVNIRLYDDGVYPDMPTEALVRLVKESPHQQQPIRSRYVRLDVRTGEVAVQPRGQPSVRGGARAKAALQAAANSSDSESRSDTPGPPGCEPAAAATPASSCTPSDAEQRDDCKLLEPWLARALLSKELDFATCTVTSVVNPGLFYIRLENDIGRLAAVQLEKRLESFTPRREGQLLQPLSPDAPPDTVACIRLPNLVWYRCRVLKRNRDSDNGLEICNLLLIDSGTEYKAAASSVFAIDDQQLAAAAPLAAPCRLYGVAPAGGQRWTRTAADKMIEIISKRENFAVMCTLVPAHSSDASAGADAVDLLLLNSSNQYDRLSNMLRLAGVALRHAEPVPPEAAYQSLLDVLRRKFLERRAENLRQRNPESAVAATPDSASSTAANSNSPTASTAANVADSKPFSASAAANVADSKPFSASAAANVADSKPFSASAAANVADSKPFSASAAANVADSKPFSASAAAPKYDASSVSQITGQAMQLTLQVDADDDYNLNEEFLLKPDGDDDDWVLGDHSPVSATAAAAAAAASVDTKAPRDITPSTSFESIGAADLVSSVEEARKPDASTVPKRGASALANLPAVQPAAEDFRWPNIRVGPLSEPIHATLSRLDCSESKMILYVMETNKASLLNKLRNAMQFYSSVSHYQYDFDSHFSSWQNRSVVFEVNQVWHRGIVMKFSFEQGLFYLKDIDTGDSYVVSRSQIKPVFTLSQDCTLSQQINIINTTPPLALPVQLWDLYPIDPDNVNSHTFRDWSRYRMTISQLLGHCAHLRVFVVRQAYCVATRELVLAATVLLPKGDELGETLINGLNWIDQFDQPFKKIAYRYDLLDADRPFTPLPMKQKTYPFIGLPPDSAEPCPVAVTDILDLPSIVSLRLLCYRDLSQDQRQASVWRQKVNNAYESITWGELYRLLQSEAPKQPPVPDTLEIPYACVARYSEDQKWYRAELIYIKNYPDGRHKVLVLFVDYGNTEWIDFDSNTKNVIREQLFVDFPCLSFRCRLQGLVRNDDLEIDQLSTKGLSDRLIQCLSDAAEPGDAGQEQRLWLSIRRRHQDGVRPNDVILYSDLELTKSANELLVSSGLMQHRRDYPSDDIYINGFELA